MKFIRNLNSSIWGITEDRDVDLNLTSKEVTGQNAPVGGSACCAGHEWRRREDALQGQQAVKDWDRTRLAYRAVKRAFDIVFSGCVLAVIAIPSLVLAAAIRLESEGSPFYSQIRVGQTRPDGSLTTFRMWKFRSMYRDADERLAELKGQNEIAGAMFKMREDPRVTKIGKFIRKHSIDEFPQFLNVFLGQMSVVGPRPPLPNEVAQYTEYDLQRLAVKPGITGWWQVTDRNNTDFDGMVRRDLEYIAKRSVVTDLKIVLLKLNHQRDGRLGGARSARYVPRHFCPSTDSGTIQPSGIARETTSATV